jgi:hypothetical protein
MTSRTTSSGADPPLIGLGRDLVDAPAASFTNPVLTVNDRTLPSPFGRDGLRQRPQPELHDVVYRFVAGADMGVNGRHINDDA